MPLEKSSNSPLPAQMSTQTQDTVVAPPAHPSVKITLDSYKVDATVSATAGVGATGGGPLQAGGAIDVSASVSTLVFTATATPVKHTHVVGTLQGPGAKIGLTETGSGLEIGAIASAAQAGLCLQACVGVDLRRH